MRQHAGRHRPLTIIGARVLSSGQQSTLINMITNTYIIVLAMVANVARPTPHHGKPHEAEHRMLSSEAAQERLSQAASAGLGWPDSHSHWADIPTDFQSHGKWRNHQHSPPVEAEQYIPNKRQAPSYSRRPASSSYDFHEPPYDHFGFDEPTYHTVRLSF